ncbi:hypothetical protein V1520DRAFT_379142 [Lipomyces starkeyi]
MNDLKPEDVAKENLPIPPLPQFEPSKAVPLWAPRKDLRYDSCCKDQGIHALGNTMLRGTAPIIVPSARTKILSSMVYKISDFKTLGKESFEQQLLLPIKNQNAIVRWRHTLTGPAKVYQCLGYDLYWLQLVHRLPESLIERLKELRAFQGARYEVLIAAVFARAGFEIEWIDDTNAAGKHPEFIATHKNTNKKVGVKTKSRRRPEGEIPFLIFIDPNVPASMPKDAPAYSSIPVDRFPWMTEMISWFRVGMRLRKSASVYQCAVDEWLGDSSYELCCAN